MKLQVSQEDKRLQEYEASFDQHRDSGTNKDYVSKFWKTPPPGVDPKAIIALSDSVLPRLAHADLRASEFQRKYSWCGMAAYGCAALAVATAATIYLRGAEPIWYSVEIGLISLILMLTWKLDDWRHQWIDYRYFAERLRATVYLYLAELQEGPKDFATDFRLASASGVWMNAVHQSILQKLPPAGIVDFPKAAKFIVEEWLDGQQDYYKRTGEKHKTKCEALEWTCKFLLGGTLIAAVSHLAFQQQLHHAPRVEHFLVWVALVFPAFSAAFAGISVFQHYQRNAERYESMSEALKLLNRSVADLNDLHTLLKEADQIMSHEHQGWRFVHGVAVPKPG